jgi:tRNA (cmo5U34)-methyltransferase
MAVDAKGRESVNLWRNADHAINYLEKRPSIPRRADAYSVLFEILPPAVERVLDLGTGDGNVLEMVLDARPGATGVGLDFQDEMLTRARARFAGREDAEFRRHDMDEPLTADLGQFDVVVSSFAIHHLEPERQMALYGEVFDRLVPGGVFANVEHVASTTVRRHEEFLYAIDSSPEQDDPSNKLVPVATHLDGLDAVGFADAECLWKWRELAVVTGTKPA